MTKTLSSVALAVALAGSVAVLPANDAVDQNPFEIAVSSFLGETASDDAVSGACILSDGTIVLAANLGTPSSDRDTKPGATLRGVLMLLSADGKRVVLSQELPTLLHDLAVDANDRLYLAAGEGGLIKLSPEDGDVLWTAKPGNVTRVAAGDDGHCAGIVDRTICIYNADGKQLGTAAGGQFTCDVCVDSASKTVIQTGFRNAHAFDGKKTYPVQIAYIRGHGYEGESKWTDYDWSTDRESDRFLNKPTNNMADSRGDRCAIGRDGKLYVTFQVAGGNHIFRYSPTDIMQKVELAGGDAYHQFYNSRAEHKCFFGRYEPATGAFLAGQQFCGRLSSGRANYVATKTGDLTADSLGRVYVVGVAASGIPLSMNPTGGDYAGGGFLLVMSPDLKQRLLCTRTCDGKGVPHAVDVRDVGGARRAVFAGSGMIDGMYVKNAIQDRARDEGDGKDDPKDGFFVVLMEK